MSPRSSSSTRSRTPRRWWRSSRTSSTRSRPRTSPRARTPDLPGTARLSGHRLQHRVCEPVLLADLRDRLGLHLEPVALVELHDRVEVRLRLRDQISELVEEVLETSRSDDLEDPRRLVAVVPECVPLLARLEDEVSRLGVNHVIPQDRSHPAIDDVAVLVLAGVLVQPDREMLRRHRVLDEREAAPGLLGPRHHARADRSEIHVPAVGWPELARPLRAVEPGECLRVNRHP